MRGGTTMLATLQHACIHLYFFHYSINSIIDASSILKCLYWLAARAPPSLPPDVDASPPFQSEADEVGCPRESLWLPAIELATSNTQYHKNLRPPFEGPQRWCQFYLNTSIEHYNAMATIFGASMATGKFAKSGNDPIVVEVLEVRRSGHIQWKC